MHTSQQQPLIILVYSSFLLFSLHGERKRLLRFLKRNARGRMAPVSSLEQVLITSPVGSKKRKAAVTEVEEVEVESEEEAAAVVKAKTSILMVPLLGPNRSTPQEYFFKIKKRRQYPPIL
ncbi:hypothetical protein L211DRAFT_833139, partial [Terfezia boudieri ATCC MYA-4762]